MAAVKARMRRSGVVDRVSVVVPAGMNLSRNLQIQELRRRPAAAPASRGERSSSKELPDNLPARGAERESDGDLVLAVCGARQQQVGDVRASDEQHQADHGHQNLERARELPAQTGHPAGRGDELELLVEESFSRELARAAEKRFLKLLLADLVVQDGDGGARLVEGDTRAEAPENVKPRAAAIVEVVPERSHLRLHGHRNADAGRNPDVDTVEACLTYPGDGERMAVDLDVLSHHGWIAVKAVGPIAMAENCDRVRARVLVVREGEGASDRGSHTKHFEIVARYKFGRDEFRAIAGAETRARGIPGHNP